jgi:uncharacterized membrane protein
MLCGAVEGNAQGVGPAVTAIDVPVGRNRARSLALTRTVGTSVVLISSAVWAVGYAAMALDRHREYRSARFDLGNMAQAVWNTAHGRFLETTLETGEQASRLAVHVDPILALFAPAAFLFSVPETLVVVQAFALVTAAWPVLQLARRRLASEAAGVFLALSYLLCPWIAWETLADFHPVALAIPLFLYAIWFLDSGRYVAFSIVAGLALACGELMGLPLLGVGLWHGVSTRRWRAASLIAAIGAAWTVVCLWVVIPAFGGGSSPFYQHFEAVGGSPGGVLETAFTNPGAIASELTTFNDIAYLILLALPFLGLFVLAPLLVLPAAPPLLVNMLSGAPLMTSVREHYVAGAIPFLFAATIVGLARFGPRRRVMLASIMLEAGVVLTLAFGPWPGFAVPDAPLDARRHQRPQNREAALAAIRLVPANAAVAATGAAGAHLSERRYFFSKLDPRVDWVLIDRSDRLVSYFLPQPLWAIEDRLRNDERWVVVFERGDVVLYHRNGR